jgi:hypothetical protein
MTTRATGLEPGTSGVTVRSCRRGVEREYAGIPDESTAFQPYRCRDWRVSVGASGDLVRDECGMLYVASRNRTGDLLGAISLWRLAVTCRHSHLAFPCDFPTSCFYLRFRRFGMAT